MLGDDSPPSYEVLAALVASLRRELAELRQKVPGCLRTPTGARQFCTIRSYLSTAAKHGTSFFDALVMLTKGKPWMPAIA